MPYMDFRPHKMWLSSQMKEEFIRISAAPLPLPQLHTLMRHFGWTGHWMLVFGVQKSEMERFLRRLDEYSIAHTCLSEERFLFKPGELKKLDEDFWSILMIPFPEDPGERWRDELGRMSSQDLYRRAFAEFGAPIEVGIHMFDVNAVLEIPHVSLAQQVWRYLVASHLVSLQVVSPERAEQCAARLPFRDWEDRRLFYWGHRISSDGDVEFVYLLLEGKEILAPQEWATYSDYQKEYYPFLRRYQFPDELPCLLLSENACEHRQFGDVRDSLRGPLTPVLMRDHRCFLWGIIPRPRGLIFYMEPFRFRHYVDFLQFDADAQVFLHSAETTIYDHHTHEPGPFWIRMPARESPMYFRYDDLLHYHLARLDGEFHFALTDAETSVDTIEERLGTSEKVSWFSFYEFFGEEGSAPPMERVGAVWDEHVSGIYLERQGDIESLVAHTVWGLFRERFDHFPNELPDSRFCTEMLGYLKGVDGRVTIEWENFWQEGEMSHLRIIARCKCQREDLPREHRAQVSYQKGKWKLNR